MTDTTRRTIRIDDDEWRASKVFAAQTDRTMSEVVRQALEFYRRLRPIEPDGRWTDLPVIVLPVEDWPENQGVLRPSFQDVEGPLVLYTLHPDREETSNADTVDQA